MSVSRKNKSIKKSSKSRKNIKKMRGGTFPLPKSVDIISFKPTIIEFYNKLSGLLSYEPGSTNRLLMSVYQSYEEYMLSTQYPTAKKQIDDINLDFINLKQGERGIGLKTFMDKIQTFNPIIILLLSLNGRIIDDRYYTSYVLSDKETIYPMCLKFVCRLYINNLDEKTLFELIVELYSDVLKYLSSILIDVCKLKITYTNAFTPIQLTDGSVLKLDDYKSTNNTSLINSFIAWFGIMNPNELHGLLEIKKELKHKLLSKITPENLINNQIIRLKYDELKGNLTVASISKLLVDE